MRQSAIKSVRGFFLALWFVIGLLAGSTRAGVSVAPLKQEISLRPGETGKLAITLNYTSRSPLDVPQDLTLMVMDVQASEDGNLFFKPAGVLKNSASKWVTLESSTVAIEPGKSQTVECQVAPPLNAAPGEYYAAVMVTLGSKGKSDKGLQIQYRIASGIFLTVQGRSFPKEAKINQFELVWPTAESLAAATQPATEPAGEIQPATQPSDKAEEAASPPLPTVRLVLQNTGQVRFDASGKLSILDDQFRTVFTAPLTTRRACIFGGDSRLFEASVTKPLGAGRYTLRVEMDYQSSWAKARQDLRVDVLPEQAALFETIKKQERAKAAQLEATPESVSAVLMPGATRSLTVNVRNTTDGPLACTAGEAADNPLSDSWFTLRPQEFTLPKGGRRTLELRVQVPPGAAADRYGSTITVIAQPPSVTAGAAPDPAARSQLAIPVDIEIKSEKHHD
jgi:hypothetical protein